ncbi:c-type cytochrome [Sphingomonas koreensis]
MKLIAGLATGAVALAGLGAALAPSFAQTPGASPAAFAACRACHTTNKGGKNGLGPNLYGIIGKPAASVPGVSYSAALKGSKLRWDEKTLDAFLANPSKKVPGTRMPIGTPDPVKRAAIIAYLKAESAK